MGVRGGLGKFSSVKGIKAWKADEVEAGSYNCPTSRCANALVSLNFVVLGASRKGIWP